MIHGSAQSLLVLLGYGAIFALLIAPAYLAARAMSSRFALDPAATPVLAFVVVALAGYVAFWCFFAKPELGRAVAMLWILAAVVAVFRLARTGIARSDALPLALTFVTGLFYLGVLYLPGIDIGAHQRFFVLRPHDNLIPQLFAEHLFQGANLKDGFLGDWHTSDRPPLQTGMLLLVRPALRLLGGVDRGYAIGGLIAQLAWIPATWLLCARAGITGRARALVFAFTIFSGFFLYNSVYTWPKLLAAGFSITALVFALGRDRRDSTVSGVLAGLCAGLALLSHGSAVFFLVPAFGLALALRSVVPLRALAWCVLALVVLLLPWSAYQRFYDPPGDRLLTMHLAGIEGVDPRPAPNAIVAAYRETPLAQIARNKLANVQTALGAAPLLASASTGEPSEPLDLWRMREREHLTAALGALNLGWLAVLAILVARGANRSVRTVVIRLLVLAFASVAFWCLVMWGPGATVTTHSAYAVELVLFVALALALAALPRPIAEIVFCVAVVDLAATWIVGSLPDAARTSPGIDAFMLVIVMLAAAAIASVLRAVAREPAAAGPAIPPSAVARAGRG